MAHCVGPDGARNCGTASHQARLISQIGGRPVLEELLKLVLGPGKVTVLVVVIGDPPLSQGRELIRGKSGDEICEEGQRISFAMIEKVSPGLVVQRGGLRFMIRVSR